MTIRHNLRRGLAAVATLTGALALVATAAVANPGDRPLLDQDSELINVLPNPDELGSLTIFKLAAPVVECEMVPVLDENEDPIYGEYEEVCPPADGTYVDLSGVSNRPIRDVTFEICRHPDIDLTTRAGWAAARDLTLADMLALQASDDLVDCDDATTDANGRVHFPDLELGLWLVRETATPRDVIPASPFVVAIPMTDPSGTEWMYDIYVYPKNATVGGEKDPIDVATYAVGDRLGWIIRVGVPHHTDDPRTLITLFRVIDDLDPRLDPILTGEHAPVVALYPVPSPLPTGVNADGELDNTLVTATWDAPTREWTFDFTVLGRAMLDNHDIVPAGSQVHITVNTEILSLGDGVIPNNYRFYPSQRHYDDGDPIDGDGESRYGGVEIVKVERAECVRLVDGDGNPTDECQQRPVLDADGNPTGQYEDVPVYLAGATFQVFRNAADAAAQTNPIAIDGVDYWTTGADGRVVIDGLRASNWENGEEIIACDATGVETDPWTRPLDSDGDPIDCFQLDGRWYYLVEIQAPDGMELLAEPIRFQVVVTGPSEGGDHASAPQRIGELTVENIAENAGFRLPMTGGMGLVIITVGGIALMIITVAITLSNRRKQAASA
ncbi:MAG: SpaH/EbpB family LPXTG-anchored major pilin [Promicromonosporaceae bacterium]|nr:SpaH/EbpB family LPXTG-anchored major pilin [Promicromonosporaceae bacterium]